MFTVKVGDEVGFARSTRYGYQSVGYATVTKINGHGHITLSTGVVFDKHGRERNKNYGLGLVEADHLRTVQYAEMQRRDQTARVRALQQKVQAMFNYGGDAHVTTDVKAELLAMVEAL